MITRIKRHTVALVRNNIFCHSRENGNPKYTDFITFIDSRFRGNDTSEAFRTSATVLHKAPLKRQGRRGLRAQSIIEYSVTIACIIAALIGMQIYVKRGIQGRLRQASDEIGEQYAPKNITATITTTLTSEVTMDSELIHLKDEGGGLLYDSYGLPVFGIETTSTIDETTQRSGSEELGKFEQGLF